MIYIFNFNSNNNYFVINNIVEYLIKDEQEVQELIIFVIFTIITNLHQVASRYK